MKHQGTLLAAGAGVGFKEVKLELTSHVRKLDGNMGEEPFPDSG